MSITKQIISPTWIAPVVPRRTLLTDHSLVVQNDRIEALLPRDAAVSQFADATELRLDQHLLTPGFVNCHGHAAMTLLRGFADDREMMDWLTKWIWPIEGRLVDAQFVYDGTRLAVMEMVMGGTTCAADSYFFPEAAARAFSDMHFRAQVGMPVMQFDNAWANGEEDHIHKGLAFRDSVRNQPRLTTAFAPHAPYSVTDEGFEKVRLYSEQLDAPIHLHLHETTQEVRDAINESGLRPVARMQELGLLSASLQAVHMTQLREDEIEQLAANGVQVVHCPESNMKLASGTCPVAQLVEAGVNVAIGTDGAASNNDLDMIQETRSASMLSKLASGDATSLSADQCLEMMTLGGARFLGLSDDIGSLEPGKQADLCAIDLSNPAFQPIFNPVSQLIYTATARDVSAVWIAGRQLLANDQLVESDTSSIVRAANGWKAQVKEMINSHEREV
ncbi:MAG: TRZ/ATZ family hydrolase [Pseudomonadales bacterium]|nr:TRZ/ATZ family hydrolase [Pseudomonadales bacterium]